MAITRLHGKSTLDPAEYEYVRMGDNNAPEHIRLVANVGESQDDPTFGFFPST